MNLCKNSMVLHSKMERMYKSFLYSYIEYLLTEKIAHLPRLLDEYIYWSDKFISSNERLIYITEEQNNYMIDNRICKYHIGDFQLYVELCKIIYISKKEICMNLEKWTEITKFYNMLFESVDNILEDKYTFGQSFDETSISKFLFPLPSYKPILLEKIPYQEIRFLFINGSIDLNKFIDFSRKEFLKFEFIDDETIMIINNNKFLFVYEDLWELLKLISNSDIVYPSFDGNLTDEQMLVLKFYY